MAGRAGVIAAEKKSKSTGFMMYSNLRTRRQIRSMYCARSVKYSSKAHDWKKVLTNNEVPEPLGFSGTCSQQIELAEGSESIVQTKPTNGRRLRTESVIPECSLGALDRPALEADPQSLKLDAPVAIDHMLD